MRSMLGWAYGELSRFVLNRRPGFQAGPGTRISLRAVVRAGRKAPCLIGRRCKVLPYAYIDTNGGIIRIGDSCHINPFAALYAGKKGVLEIGNHVLIAAHATIVASNHVFDSREIPISMQSIRSAGIVIEDDVWIASGAKVLDGVRIGRGSVVAAGAVVTRDVQPYSVVAGVPAKVIRMRGAANA